MYFKGPAAETEAECVRWKSRCSGPSGADGPLLGRTVTAATVSSSHKKSLGDGSDLLFTPDIYPSVLKVYLRVYAFKK